jgi:cytochrome P450
MSMQGDWYKILATPNHHFQHAISEVDQKRHALRAKNIASAFTLTNLLKAEQHLDRLIELLMIHLGQFADTHQPVEFNRWFKYMTFDIIGEMIFSRPFGFLESGADIGGAIATVRFLTSYVAVAGFFITLHRWTLGNPFLPKLGWLPAQHIFDTIDSAIHQRRSNPEVRFDMLEHWKRVVADHPERMAEKDLHSSAIMTVGAGTDTINAALQALLYYLLRSPKHLDRVKAEIRSATTSKIVSFAEAQELPFLQACVGSSCLFLASSWLIG